MVNLNKLRWQCRRGVKELDAVLLDFLDQQYLAANTQEQQLFIQLLALEDDCLLAYFYANHLPSTVSYSPDKDLEQFIEKIRTAFVASS